MDVSDVEREVLHIVEAEGGVAGWLAIESGLAAKQLPRPSNVVLLLERMVARGLLENAEMGRWRLPRRGP